MRRLLLWQDIRLICRSVVRFLDRSSCIAMACFFNCFRARDDQSTNQFVSHSNRSKSRGNTTSRNRLSSLFLAEERADSPCHERGRVGLDSIQIDKSLRDEAKFLKACGTIPETPIEIRKATRKLDSSNGDRYSEFSSFQAKLPNKPITKFQLDEKLDEPLTPVEACEESEKKSIALEQTPSSCMTNVQNSGRISASFEEQNDEAQGSVSTGLHELSDGNTQGRKRSVQFECDSDAFSSGGSSQNISSEKPETVGKTFFMVSSPNRTPLKLYDEMQTPETIFPINGKAQVRSRFECSFTNQTESVSLSMVPEESESMKAMTETQYSADQKEGKSTGSEIQVDKVEETTAKKDLKVEASISAGLKSLPTSNEDDNENLGALSSKAPCFGQTPGDRPIIGLVALHWNEEESSHVLGWDGNGIPNSTNKYKEDQKVSWHATPFEERLEKALSEESFVSQRSRFSGMQIVFNKNERDTATSQLRPSANSKSAVLF